MILRWILSYFTSTRIALFPHKIIRKKYFQNSPKAIVFHGAIARHYGIPTNCVDVSTDLRTALFFACCRYENGQWRPLEPDEFAAANSRDLGEYGDARYGIIFCALGKAGIDDILHNTLGRRWAACTSQTNMIIRCDLPLVLFY